MNKYRIYLNNNNLSDSVDIFANYPIIMGSTTIFYGTNDCIIASIPINLVFIKLNNDED